MMQLVFEIDIKHIILCFWGNMNSYVSFQIEYVPNKHAGRKNVQILINMLFLIRACWMEKVARN